MSIQLSRNLSKGHLSSGVLTQVIDFSGTKCSAVNR